MPLKLNSTNGSITISAEDGSGNANITLPRSGIGSVSALSDLSITATAAELNYVDGVTSAIQTQIDTKAPLASPALTGTPTAPTATAGDSSTKIATTAFVGTEVSNLVDSAPSTLNTLNELAAALGDDANFSTTVTNSIAAKLPLAGGTMTGDIAHASDFTIDAGANISLDADGGNIIFKDGGAQIGAITVSSTDVVLQSTVQDRDLIFKGNDGGATTTLLTLDVSEAGKATFNSDIVAPRFVDSASSSYFVDPFGTSFLAYAYLQQSFAANSALSGTTPTITADTHSSFSLTTSGNTTFTFSVGSISTGYLIGFVLKLTSGGSHTITYPNTVDFAGGAAPDAPASGETDILVFTSIDGGTNWYGARAIDAAA